MSTRDAAEQAEASGGVAAASEGEVSIGAAPMAPDRPVGSARDRTGDQRIERQLFHKRTIIPILLTCGLLLIAGSALGLMGVVGHVEWWVPVLLIATGLSLLSIAGMNMLQVRDLLRRQAAPGAGPVAPRGIQPAARGLTHGHTET